jgi:ribosome-associated protein
MDSKKLALLCRDLAENRKAENVVVMDVRVVSSVTDFYVVASGTSEPHLRAIVDEIRDKLRDEHDIRPRVIEGDAHDPWRVLDFFDVIVHVMRHDVREKYDLEGLWGDVPRVKTRVRAAAKKVATKRRKRSA